jgi:hypothetical protein
MFKIQLILIIGGFHICEFAYFLQLICNFQINICGVFISFTDISPDEVGQGILSMSFVQSI